MAPEKSNRDVVVSTLLATSAPAPTPVADFEDLLINCGGGAYTDTEGRQWAADYGFEGGNPYSTTADIAGTADDTVRL